MAKWLGVSVVYHNNCNSHLNYFSGVSIGGKGMELGLRTCCEFVVKTTPIINLMPGAN